MRNIWPSWMRKNDQRPNPLMVLLRLQNTSTLVQTQTDPMSHCISDRVWNYYQAGMKKLGFSLEWLRQPEVAGGEMLDKIEEFYKNLRVDGVFGNHNPRSMAGALIYLTCVKLNIETSQSQVAEIVGLKGITIGHWFRLMNERWKREFDKVSTLQARPSCLE